MDSKEQRLLDKHEISVYQQFDYWVLNLAGSENGPYSSEKAALKVGLQTAQQWEENETSEYDRVFHHP